MSAQHTPQEHRRYLASVAKTTVMRNALNSAADEIDRLSAQVEAEKSASVFWHDEASRLAALNAELVGDFKRIKQIRSKLNMYTIANEAIAKAQGVQP